MEGAERRAAGVDSLFITDVSSRRESHSAALSSHPGPLRRSQSSSSGLSSIAERSSFRRLASIASALRLQLLL